MSSSGRGFFRAIELPFAQEPYRVRIDSLVIRANESRYVAVPLVIVLDGAFHPLRVFDPSVFAYHRSSLLGRAERISLSLAVDHPPIGKEKYIVITTAEALQGRQLRIADRGNGELLVETVSPHGVTPKHESPPLVAASDGFLQIQVVRSF
jgi:Maltose operon periplasmic protein precursor (MalM)